MSWTARILFLCLLGLIVGLPAAWRPEAARVPEGSLRLVIITPHNEQIRQEIGRAFSDWHRTHHASPVFIDWRAGSGTSDIERVLLSAYEGLLEQGRMDEGAGYDLLFGGGDFFFQKMKKGVHGENTILEPVHFGEGFLRDVYPHPLIADKPLYDPEGHWFGVVLSSFGIVSNADVLGELGVEREPRTWEDLGDPRLIGRVALGDPSHSGSVRVTYEAILQRYGWDRGWKTLRRACANSRYFANSSSKVVMDVSAGDAAAGMCIDFYGRFQSEVVGERRAHYTAPADATVITADPVAVLLGTRKPELAARFVQFLLTREGQAVWCYRQGDPLGPRSFELRRPPVRRDMYQPESLARMVDPIDMFALAQPLEPGTPSYFAVLPTVLHAMAMDIHDELRDAWQAIRDEPDAGRRAAMIVMFDALPFTPQDLAAAPARWKFNPATQHADRLAWTAFFRERYRRVASLERNP